EFHYPTIIFDAGSGEGSHLQKIINECRDRAITGIGLDIAKEGIIMASKNYHNPIWLVGDLANIPLTDQSSHVVVNILSPANDMAFKRVLAPEGIIVKIVPRPNYFKELREVIFTISDNKTSIKRESKAEHEENCVLVNKYR